MVQPQSQGVDLRRLRKRRRPASALDGNRFASWLIISFALHVCFTRHGVCGEKKFKGVDLDPQQHHIHVRQGQVTPAMETDYHVRCVGEALFQNETDRGSPQKLLQRLSETTCNKCQPAKVTQHKKAQGDKPIYHAMVLLTEDVPQLIPIATALLGTGHFKLTILRFHFEKDADVKNQSSGAADDPMIALQDERFRNIHRRVMAGINCNHPVRTRKDALTVVDAALPDSERSFGASCNYPSSVHPFELCSIESAPATAQVLEKVFRFSLSNANESSERQPFLGRTPDVLIADASLMGGLWISELWKIPTVAVANHNFLPLVMEHDPLWTVPDTSPLNRLWKALKQRWYSLSLTSSFIQLNFLRKRINLPPFRSPMDYFKPVVAVLMDFIPPDSLPLDPWLEGALDDIGNPTPSFASGQSNHARQWQNVHILDGSLQSPCILCDPTTSNTGNRMLSSRNQKKVNPTIFVVPPSDTTPERTRSILQGIILARESLQVYDDCEWLSTSCQKPYANFEVIWLKPTTLKEDYFPPSVPEYIHREDSVHILDNLSRHPEIIAAVLPCDADSALMEQDLALSILCISATDRMPLRPDQTPPPALEPRSISGKLLQLLRKRQQTEEMNGATLEKGTSSRPGQQSAGRKAMLRAVQIVYRTAQIHRSRLQVREWDSVDEMREVMLDAIEEQWGMFEKQENRTSRPSRKLGHARSLSSARQPYDNLTVLVAWTIILASAAYVFALDRLWVRPTRRSFHHVHTSYHSNHHASTAAFSEGIWGRIVDLEDSWSLWSGWFKEQSFPFQSLLEDENGSSNRPHMDGGGQHATTQYTANQSNPNVRRRKKR